MSEVQSADRESAADSGSSESAADVHFAYQRSRSVDRGDTYGRVVRWIGEHPFSAGLGGGVVVVVIASLSAPQGIAAAPVQAGILSLMVIAIWAVLFYFMRDFFVRQSRREETDSYSVEADASAFRFERNGEPIAAVDRPSYELRLAPGADPSPERPGSATRVWLVIRGDSDDDALFVMETKVTAGEASQYPQAEDALEPDEELPIHLASGLLQLADRAE